MGKINFYIFISLTLLSKTHLISQERDFTKTKRFSVYSSLGTIYPIENGFNLSLSLEYQIMQLDKFALNIKGNIGLKTASYKDQGYKLRKYYYVAPVFSYDTGNFILEGSLGVGKRGFVIYFGKLPESDSFTSWSISIKRVFEEKIIIKYGIGFPEYVYIGFGFSF